MRTKHTLLPGLFLRPLAAVRSAVALLAIASLLALGACTGSGAVDDDIEAADYAADTQNYDEALQICNMLVDNQKLQLSDRQLGRLAIVYMKLADLADEDENMARAAICYRQGMEISPDSLRDFYRSLSLDDTRHFDLLSKIGRSLDQPCDLEDCDADSVDAIIDATMP